jgi:hypothetical protein
MREIILYHGSNHIIEQPQFGTGKPYNDYGLGFYCTENMELAKEWACTAGNGGFANQYRLHTEELHLFSLLGEDMHILNWLAVLLQNRTFQISGDLAAEAKEYVLKEFLPDLSHWDVIRGYRADDSYFSFATAFLNGGLSFSQLSYAMRLGKLGEQVVLKTERAFSCLEFIGYSQAEQAVYYPMREARDSGARNALKQERRLAKAADDIYIIDILREEWKNDDRRLR